MSTVVSKTNATATGRTRDPFIDILRAGAIIVVACGHWIMPVLSRHGDTLVATNALSTPGWWLLTWPLQVMPVFFFAGGAANHHSYQRATNARTWLANRLGRLIIPVLPLVAIWLALPSVLLDLGVPRQPVDLAAAVVGQLLWFLAVYVIAIAAIPILSIAHRRWGLRTPAALGLAALGVDTLRFHGVPFVGYLNEILVWLAITGIGIAYATGGIDRRNAGGMAVFGCTAAALLVLFGHYSPSMVGLPGEASNMAPVTTALLCLGIGQIGVLVSLRERIVNHAPRTALDAIGARCMTVYLWHMPALVLVAGVGVLAFGYATPPPDSLGWLVATPLWIAATALVLSVFVRIFGRVETIRIPARTPGTVGLVAAVTTLCAGLAGISIYGFATPLLAAACGVAILTGLVLALPGAATELATTMCAKLIDRLFS